jgi:hypothetical protein
MAADTAHDLASRVASELQRRGVALERIAQQLEAQGIPLPETLTKPNDGGKWSASAAARLLAQVALARSAERQAAERMAPPRRTR